MTAPRPTPRLVAALTPRLVVALLTAALWAATAAGAEWGRRPKLILQITVDQLRGDLPARYYDEFGPGGFRYLLDRGVVYGDAHQAHASTETVVGHTTLATGAYPAVHGMIGNDWFDREAGRSVYCVEDDRYAPVPPAAGAARSDGRSPANILTTTLTDELAIATNGRAKIFGVSLKDRAAITLAGHAGKAFWFSKTAGEFVTSTYYADRLPAWAAAWNGRRLAAGYAGTSWSLLRERRGYLFADNDDQPWEESVAGFGRTFPHAYGPADGKDFGELLAMSPAGDALTLDFAKALIQSEALGTRSVTDYLSISLSSTDYVGHAFGPASLESEDNLLRLDRGLADLFRFVDRRIGLANTLIVLSADHGTPESPGYLRAFGIDGGFVQTAHWADSPGLQALARRLKVEGPLIREVMVPNVYLNRAAIQARGLDEATVEDAVSAELMKLDGVAFALGAADLSAGRVAPDERTRLIRRNLHPARSGDVYVVLKPQWFEADDGDLQMAASHGSPWRFDTFVPIIFAGYGLEPRQVYRPVETVDVAPTLSVFVSAKPPSGATGNPLVEVFESRTRAAAAAAPKAR